MMITVEAVVNNLSKVLSWVDSALEEHDCPMRTQMEIDLAVEELFVNICHYAYGSEVGYADIVMNFAEDPEIVQITLIDSGIPFNPLSNEDPDITLPAEQRNIGGLGILMVKKSMDEVRYHYSEGKNHISIRKRLFNSSVTHKS